MRKFFFSKIPSSLRLRSKKDADKRPVWKRGFHVPFWSIIYGDPNLNSICETGDVNFNSRMD